jgi:hypothetical protein
MAAEDEEFEGGLDESERLDEELLHAMIALTPPISEEGDALRETLDEPLRELPAILVKKLLAVARSEKLQFLESRCVFESRDRPRRGLQSMIQTPAKLGDWDYEPPEEGEEAGEDDAAADNANKVPGIFRRRYFYTSPVESRMKRVPGMKRPSVGSGADDGDDSDMGEEQDISNPLNYEELHLLPHQAGAVIKLVNQLGSLPDSQRKALGANWHCTGAGKTVTAAANMAARHVLSTKSESDLADPTGYFLDQKWVVVAPKGVILPHLKEFLKFLVLPTRYYLVATHWKMLTEEALAKAKLIIISYPCLSECLKLSWWENPAARYRTVRSNDGGPPRQQPIKAKERATRPTAQHIKKRPGLAEFPDQPPPDHPIFSDAFRRKVNLIQVDESQMIGKSTTWSNLAVRMLTEFSVEAAAFSGTPVKNNVSENASFNKAMSTVPELYRTVKAWRPKKASCGDNSRLQSLRAKSICRSTNNAFHLAFVHNCQRSEVQEFMPLAKRTTIRFDPFVGRLPDGTFDLEVQQQYNGHVGQVRDITATSIMNQNAPWAQVHGTGHGGYSDVMKAMMFCEQAAFSNFLCKHIGGLKPGDMETLNAACDVPSQYMRLLYRAVRHWQTAGRVRILMYCHQTSYAFILMRYFARMEEEKDPLGSVGSIFRIDGKTASIVTRERSRLNFLKCPKGVMLISNSGSVGLNFVPGCEVVFTYASLPWSPTDKEQAEGRVNRIKVQRQPVELVTIMPKGGVFEAKLQTMHEDKANRLVKACTEHDYSHFSRGINAEAACWSERHQMAKAVELLDATGNQTRDVSQRAAEVIWRAEAREAQDMGLPPPRRPDSLVNDPNPMLADQIELPPVHWPVAGFDEACYLTECEAKREANAKAAEAKKAAEKAARAAERAANRSSSKSKKQRRSLEASEESEEEDDESDEGDEDRRSMGDYDTTSDDDSEVDEEEEENENKDKRPAVAPKKLSFREQMLRRLKAPPGTVGLPPTNAALGKQPVKAPIKPTRAESDSDSD